MDIGCGAGLTLALLAEARAWARAGRWPAEWSAPPLYDRLIGIETRARPASIAQAALGADATIVHGDARAVAIEPCRTVLLFDVLHLLPNRDQQALIDRAAAALEPGGVLLVREADAGGGWRFVLVRLGNLLKAAAFGNWGQRFHFRTTDEWLTCFAGWGVTARVRPMGAGTPFANVLFEITVPTRASATIRQPSPLG